MSVAGLLDAMRSTYPATHRLVWQCLENHANGAGFWSMTCQQIASELQVGIATVKRAVADLARDGVIRTVHHKRRATTFYMMRSYPGCERTHQFAHEAQRQDTWEPPWQATPAREDLSAQIETPTQPAPAAVEGSDQHVNVELTAQTDTTTPELRDEIDPPLIHQEVRSTSKSPPEGKTRVRATPRSSDADQQRVLDAWNAMADETDLAQARVMSDRRRARLGQRIREHGLDGVLEAIAAIGASGFCHGRNQRGWRADFDFLLQDGSLTRAREGRYDDRAAAFDPSNLSGFAAVAYEASREIAAHDAALEHPATLPAVRR